MNKTNVQRESNTLTFKEFTEFLDEFNFGFAEEGIEIKEALYKLHANNIINEKILYTHDSDPDPDPDPNTTYSAIIEEIRLTLDQCRKEHLKELKN